MDITKHRKCERLLVEQVGIARVWDLNQSVIAIIDKHGVEVAEGILEGLQQHATDTETLHIQSLECEKAL